MRTPTLSLLPVVSLLTVFACVPLQVPPPGPDAGTDLDGATPADGGVADASSPDASAPDAGEPDDNHAPAFGTAGELTVTEGSVLDVAIEATDPDGDAFTIALIDGPAWASVDEKRLVLRPGYADAGVAHLKLVATDAFEGRSEIVVTVTVIDTNRAPEIEAPEAISVSEGDTATRILKATDPDGDTVAWSLTGAIPPFVTLEEGTLRAAPGFEAAGGYEISFTADDAHGGAATATLAIRVSDTDRPPTVAVTPEANVAEGSRAIVAVLAADPDGDAVVLSLAEPSPKFASIDGASGLVTLEPGFDAAGAYTVKIVATAGNASASAELAITVANTNRAPRLEAIADVSLVGGNTQEMKAVAIDPDAGDVLSFAFSGQPSWATAAGAVLTLAPAPLDAGSFPITVVAKDAEGLTASTSFTVRVTRRESAPTILNLAQITPEGPVGPGQGASVAPTLSATLADAENDRVQLEVEVRAATQSFTGTATHRSAQGAPGSAEVALAGLPVGTYRWQARAVDATGRASAWTEFTGGFQLLVTALAGSVTIDGGAFTRSPSITLQIAATPSGGATLATMAISNDGTAWSPETPFAATAPWNLSSGEGQKTVVVRVTDSLGNSGQFRASTTFDRTAPAGTFSLDNNAAFARTPRVALVWEVSDAVSGLERACFSNDGQAFDCVTPTTKARDWTLTAGDGRKTVTARFIDRAGNTLESTQAITVDATPPVLSLAINDGARSTAQTDVTLFVTASDASGLKELCFSNDGVAFSGCVDREGRVQWALAKEEGVRTVTLRGSDVAGNVATASDTIVLDATAPKLALTIENTTLVNGVRYASRRPLALTLAASDTGGSGLEGMQFSNDGATWSALEPAGATKTWEPTTPEGAKTISARTTDGAGNVSKSATADVVLDTVPPAVTVVINNGAATTATTQVTVAITATDATSGPFEIQFSNDDRTWSTAEPFISTKTWTLATGTGSKTVSARVSDRAGNTAISSDTINLDTSAPGATLTVNDGAVATNSRTVTLKYSAFGPAGLSQVCASNDGATWTCNLAIPSSATTPITATWTLPDADTVATVTLRATAVGGAIATATDTIILDRQAPVLSSFVVNGDAAWTKNPSVTLDHVITGVGGSQAPITQACAGVTTSGLTCVDWVPTPTLLLPSGDGQKTVYLKVRDAAGNESTLKSDTISLDQTPPSIGAFVLQGGADFTNNATVNAATSASDAGGLAFMSFSTDGGLTDSTPVAFVGLAAVTLPGVDGTKSVRVRVQDSAGNTATATASIKLDREAPVGTVKLNNGATFTNAPANVTVGVAATDSYGVTGFCLRNSVGVTPAANDPCWYPMAAAFSPYVLPAGEGVRNVYAYYRDAAGNVSVPPASATIVVDTTVPDVSAGFIAASTYGLHRSITAAWNPATDGGSSLAGYQIGSAAPGGAYVWSPVIQGTTASIDALANQVPYDLKYRAIDKAGNVATSVAVSRTPRFPLSFMQRGPTSEPLTAVASRSAAELVAVGTSGNMLTSDDGGVTWSRLDPDTDASLSAVAFAPSKAGIAVGAGVATFNDGGAHIWHAAPAAGGKALYAVARIGAGPRGGSDTYLAAGDGVLLKVDASAYDGSEAWVDLGLPAGVAAGIDLYNVAVCPPPTCDAKPVVVVAGQFGTMLRSVDGGATFAKVATPESASFLGLVYAGGLTFYASTTTDVIRSVNGGATWTSLTGEPAMYIRALAANSPTRVTLLGSELVSFNSNPKVAAFDGTTFAAVTVPGGAGLAVRAGLALGTTQLVAVGERGQVITGAFASAWTLTQRSTGAMSDLYAVSAAPGGTSYFVTGSNGVVMKPPALFQTAWQVIDTGIGWGLASVHAFSDTSWIAVGANATILRQTSSGGVISNLQIAGQTSQLNGVSCNAAGTFCVAVGADSIINDWKGGAWAEKQKITGGPTLNAVTAYTVGGVNRAIAVGTGGTVYRITDTTSRVIGTIGDTFPYYGLAWGDGVAVAVQGTALMRRSTDDGATWTKVPGPPGVSGNLWSVAYAGSGVFYAAGSSGLVLRSTDAGVTWSAVASTGSSKTLRGIAGRGDSLWVVGNEGVGLVGSRGGD